MKTEAEAGVTRPQPRTSGMASDRRAELEGRKDPPQASRGPEPVAAWSGFWPPGLGAKGPLLFSATELSATGRGSPSELSGHTRSVRNSSGLEPETLARTTHREFGRRPPPHGVLVRSPAWAAAEGRELKPRPSGYGIQGWLPPPDLASASVTWGHREYSRTCCVQLWGDLDQPRKEVSTDVAYYNAIIQAARIAPF